MYWFYFQLCVFNAPIMDIYHFQPPILIMSTNVWFGKFGLFCNNTGMHTQYITAKKWSDWQKWKQIFKQNHKMRQKRWSWQAHNHFNKSASIAANKHSQNKMCIMLIGTNVLVFCLQRAQILYNFLAQKKINNNSRTIFSSADQTYAHTHTHTQKQHKHTHTSRYDTIIILSIAREKTNSKQQKKNRKTKYSDL